MEAGGAAVVEDHLQVEVERVAAVDQPLRAAVEVAFQHRAGEVVEEAEPRLLHLLLLLESLPLVVVVLLLESLHHPSAVVDRACPWVEVRHRVPEEEVG